MENVSVWLQLGGAFVGVLVTTAGAAVAWASVRWRLEDHARQLAALEARLTRLIEDIERRHAALAREVRTGERGETQ